MASWLGPYIYTADKSLLNQEGNKLQQPNSNFCKPVKKNSEGCPSNQVSAAAMTSASDEKWRPFNCFFSQARLRTYQHPCIYKYTFLLQILHFIKNELFIYSKAKWELLYEITYTARYNYFSRLIESTSGSETDTKKLVKFHYRIYTIIYCYYSSYFVPSKALYIKQHTMSDN